MSETPLSERNLVSASHVGSPVARDRVHRPAPRLGEHTDEVLATVLAMSPAEIAQLRQDGVVV